MKQEQMSKEQPPEAKTSATTKVPNKARGILGAAMRRMESAKRSY